MASLSVADNNLSAVLHGIDDLRLEQMPIPQPSESDVLLAIDSVGICGSDVHYLKHGAIGPYVVKAPMILGHESSGTVIGVGSAVTSLSIGDRVAIEPGVPCRMCALCKNGRYNLCPDVVFSATPPVHGSLTRFFSHPADFCYKLPDHVSYEEGALLEPLSVAVHACSRGEVKIGHKVLITGAGPIGLMNLQTAKACGAAEVIMADVDDQRLKFAVQMGADHVVNVAGKDGPLIADEVCQALSTNPDVTIECSGTEAAICLAISATKNGGTIVLVGCSPPTVTVPLIDAALKEIDFKTVFRYANRYPTALALVASGKVNVKPLVTHRFTLEDTAEAFNTARLGLGGAIKVMIKCSKT